MAMSEEQKAKNQAFLQARYEELAEAWATWFDREEEDAILIRIMDLDVQCRKKGYKLCLHSWIKDAIADFEKRNVGRKHFVSEPV